MLSAEEHVENNPVNYVDPYGLDICGAVTGLFGKKKECKETAKAIAENVGYIDINGSFCAALCVSLGVQASFAEGIHGYAGGGFGVGAGLTAQYAPGQHINTGVSCGVAGSPGIVSGQFGRSGYPDKEGQLFVEGEGVSSRQVGMLLALT